jgi:hypothetical protein
LSLQFLCFLQKSEPGFASLIHFLPVMLLIHKHSFLLISFLGEACLFGDGCFGEACLSQGISFTLF